ncbi:uncharacterized protein LOC132945341 [Metopolophium dirhodum]|uniref:uncharacterized protein LOC132945341 n=1 Tax=Metopolophium dirhodum TaxID=44670 RepID=UPI00299004A3|nr:uncharacterized protein LOC132945341 [Metopolophium dirhodum]
MKFLLCFYLVCAVAIAKPMDEAKKSEQLSASLSTKNETVISNLHRVERNDKISPIVQVSSELNDNNKSKTDETQSADDKQRLSYDSTINQANPSAYSSQLTSIHNTDSSYPESSDNEQYRSVGSAYPSERSFGPLESPGLVSSSYPLMSYGLRPGSYGYSGSNGLSGSYGYSGSNGLSGSYYGLSGSYGPSEPCGSNSVIPTSHFNSIPCQGGIAQQIIHKPVVTELQEVIHKPIITEVQEIVNKPVFSEVQQVIHKPLFTEHIGLGPSYHGYQKHIVNQPIYHTPTKHFVRQPMSHAATIHLADEYEQHVSNGHSNCEPETSSSYGFTGSSFPITYGPGINVAQPSGQYKSVGLSDAPYEPVYSSGISTSDSPSYSSLRASTPYGYPSMSSAPGSYKNAAHGSIGYSTPTSSFGYSSLPSYNELGSISRGIPYGQQIATFNTGNNGPYRSIKESSQPKAAEQIMYDKFMPYTQQLNGNQQYYDNPQFQQKFSGFQQQRGRSNEDPKQIKMDVDAIAKQIEKNPEMRKQLIKIITESIYVGDQMTQSNKKQQDTGTKTQSLPLI